MAEREVKIPIRADDKASKQIKQVDRALLGMRKTVRSLTSPLRALGSAYGSVKSSILSVHGAVVGLVGYLAAKGYKSIIDQADALGKLASATGDTVENLSQLQIAFGYAGISADKFRPIITQLNNVEQAALRGTPEAIETFRRLGLSLESLPTTDRLTELAAAMERLGEDTFRELLTKLFPKKALDLIVLLKDGVEGFRSSIKRAGDSGGIITQRDATIAAEFNDVLLDITTSAEALFRTFVIDTAPSAVKLMQRLNDLLREMNPAINSVIDGWATLSEVFAIAISGDGSQAGINLEITKLADRYAETVRKIQELRSEVGFLTTDLFVETGEAEKQQISDDIKSLQEQIGALEDRRSGLWRTIQDLKAQRDFVPSAKVDRSATAERQPNITPSASADVADYEKIAKSILQLKQPLREVRLELLAIEKAQFLRTLEQQLKAAGIEGEEFAATIEMARQEFDRLQELERGDFLGGFLNAARATADEWTDLSKAGEETFDVLKRGVDGVGDAIYEAFVERSKSAKEAFSELAASVAEDLARLAIRQGLQQLLGALIPGANTPVAAAKGRVFDRGGITAFAAGGIVDRPTVFPFAGGIGLMGEAGPEAVMPLERRNGILGVRASGEGGGTFQLNVYASDGAEWIRKNEAVLRSQYHRWLHEDRATRQLTRRA